jgi:cytochrome c peroxidase
MRGQERLGRFVATLWLVPVAIFAVVVLVGACSSGGHHSASAKLGFDPHGDAGVAGETVTQILNAAQTVTASTPQAVLVAEGQKLFESTTLARQGEACATCHINGGGVNMRVGIINHPTKPGDFTGPRTPIALWGVAHTAPYTWDGHVATLEQQVTNTILNFFTAGKTQPVATTAGQMAALVAYLNTLEPPRTAFDNGTMSAQALEGQRLFNSVGCVECHAGPLFTDNKLHVIGVPQVSNENDPGNPGVAGGFNTPGLRDVRNLAPYMHNGVFDTLSRVLDFYSGNREVGIRQLNGPEKDAIVAFLNSL